MPSSHTSVLVFAPGKHLPVLIIIYLLLFTRTRVNVCLLHSVLCGAQRQLPTCLGMQIKHLSADSQACKSSGRKVSV